MFQIDKAQFGAFVAELRRERGMTQKELAQKLYISDKAVSKWETGTSLPDISLLTPLAEELGVTAAELLSARRMDSGETMDVSQADTLLRRALELSPSEGLKRPGKRRVLTFIGLAALSAADEAKKAAREADANAASALADAVQSQAATDEEQDAEIAAAKTYCDEAIGRAIGDSMKASY